MIQVAALTSGKHTPSARFRVRQHLEILKTHDVYVDEYIPAIEKGRKVPFLPESIKPRYVPPLYLAWIGVKAATRVPGIVGSRTHQITWLQRELIPGLYTVERFLKTPIVYDVDDAIWAASMMGVSTNKRIAQRSEIIIAGNQYLADWFSQYNRNIEIVPTAIDTDRFIPAQTRHTDKFIVGWTGTYGNLAHLEAIEPALNTFLEQHKDAVLRILCDKPPSFKLIVPEKVDYIQWNYENEVRVVQSFDIGIMPLNDDEWTRGKCSFKMLQYMGCGIPYIVSPVGMNTDVLKMGQAGLGAISHDNWYEALEHYYRHRDTAVSDGLQGRTIVLENFSQQVIAHQLASVFRSLS